MIVFKYVNVVALTHHLMKLLFSLPIERVLKVRVIFNKLHWGKVGWGVDRILVNFAQVMKVERLER